MRVTNMMRRATFFFGAVLAGLLIFGAPAHAQETAPAADDDYTACSNFTVDPSSANPGDSVTVTGTAATGGATIDIFVNDALAAQTTSDAGTNAFSADVDIPADASDPVVITAKQEGDATDPFVGCTQVASLEILAPVEPLARTGANSTLPLVRLGFALVAAGGLVILVSRRRKLLDVAA